MVFLLTNIHCMNTASYLKSIRISNNIVNINLNKLQLIAHKNISITVNREI